MKIPSIDLFKILYTSITVIMILWVLWYSYKTLQEPFDETVQCVHSAEKGPCKGSAGVPYVKVEYVSTPTRKGDIARTTYIYLNVPESKDTAAYDLATNSYINDINNNRIRGFNLRGLQGVPGYTVTLEIYNKSSSKTPENIINVSDEIITPISESLNSIVQKSNRIFVVIKKIPVTAPVTTAPVTTPVTTAPEPTPVIAMPIGTPIVAPVESAPVTTMPVTSSTPEPVPVTTPVVTSVQPAPVQSPPVTTPVVTPSVTTPSLPMVPVSTPVEVPTLFIRYKLNWGVRSAPLPSKTWTTVPYNTIVKNTLPTSDLSINNGRITLPPGTYTIFGKQGIFANHAYNSRIRIFNVTNNRVETTEEPVYSAGGNRTMVHLKHELTVSSPTVLEIQVFQNSSKSGWMGTDTNGVTETSRINGALLIKKKL